MGSEISDPIYGIIHQNYFYNTLSKAEFYSTINILNPAYYLIHLKKQIKIC